jgi:Tfp pilus assembly protein PilZ
MRSRPWPVFFLATIQILSPAWHIFLNSWLRGLEVMAFLEIHFQTRRLPDLLAFYLLMPIAGLALYSFRRWSYPVFVAALAYSAYSNYSEWHQSPETYPVQALLSLYIFDLLFVGYFMLPSVRAIFFNPEMRWWEAKPRYQIRLAATIETGENSRRCRVSNLSEGGAFIRTSEAYNPGTQVRLSLSVFDIHLRISAKIAHRRPVESSYGYGVQFVHTPETLQMIKKIVKGLSTMGVTPTRGTDWADELKHWIMTLIRTGKGWVPDPPPPRRESSDHDSDKKDAA